MSFFHRIRTRLAFAFVLVALYLDRRITKPIEYLTEQADKVSMGELLNPVSVQDKGEIGQLPRKAWRRIIVSVNQAFPHWMSLCYAKQS